jgi:PKD repeat protein
VTGGVEDGLIAVVEGRPLTINVSQPLSIDWGDGTVDSSASHTYADEGQYAVVITAIENGITTVESVTVSVTNAAPKIVSLQGEANPQQAEFTFTATASYTDLGPVDMHTAEWDWGDGNTSGGPVSEANGSGSVSGNHTYAAPGVYTVKVTVTDDAGAEASEMITTVIAGVRLRPDGTLEVIGTDGNDGGLVHRLGSMLMVEATFLPRRFPWLPVGVRSFPLGDVQRIWADLGGGNDVFAVANGLALPTSIRGGEGNDALTGGGGLSLLLGGKGNDFLYGGSGRSVLVGGRGTDWLMGGAAEDILLGGSAQLDNDPEADDADIEMAAVLSAWGSGAYSDRVSAIDALLDDLDDAEADRLAGGNGRDLFFDALGDTLVDVKTSGTNKETVL